MILFYSKEKICQPYFERSEKQGNPYFTSITPFLIWSVNEGALI